jgi:FkbM family methyltransferase
MSEIGLHFGILIRKVDRKLSQNYYNHDSSSQIANISELQEKYIGKKKNGIFIEVGSYNGKEFGFVWGLVKRGWRGILVEPIPSNIIKIRKNYINYKNIKILEFAITDDKKPLHLYEGEQLSGKYKPKKYYNHKIVKVKTMKLSELCNSERIPRDFDLLSIDVEGAEEEVVNSFNFNTWRPKMVIIELTETKLQSIHAASHKRILISMLNKYKYVIVYKDWINTVFVRSDLYLTK